MTGAVESFLRENVEIYRCPRCGDDLRVGQAALECVGCGQSFEVAEGMPRLFWPHDWDPSQEDVTETVKSFYEETPFPDYNDLDSAASLAQRARAGVFARLLDQQVPRSARIIECGCGTGQLSNFLSISGRTVFGGDMCLNSLRLGQGFARKQELDDVHFTQMNLFRPPFKPGSFDLVISNGVLMVTTDPFVGFKTISELVKPGGYLLIGLYHKYGRLITDLRRQIFRLTGDRFTFLDPQLRNPKLSDARKRAWFADQYKHPHETKNTIGEVIGWFEKIGFEFVKSVPRTRPFRPITDSDRLFAPEKPGNALERNMVELGMTFKGSFEGGFFIVIGRRP